MEEIPHMGNLVTTAFMPVALGCYNLFYLVSTKSSIKPYSNAMLFNTAYIFFWLGLLEQVIFTYLVRTKNIIMAAVEYHMVSSFGNCLQSIF